MKRNNIYALILMLTSLLVLSTFAGCSEDKNILDYVNESVEEDTADIDIQEDLNGDEPVVTDIDIQEDINGDVPLVTDTAKLESTGIEEKGIYTSKEEVALYIKTYECLPSNFITKKEAQSLGWSGGSLEPYDSGKCIGGSYFGNYEGLLLDKEDREYYECDIDTLYAESRGAKRIVYSNDGLIYYTDDHYESFTLLYEGE